jgi:hypothetical protein
MKYIIPLIVSLPIFILPTIGNKSISLATAFLIFGYFWFGVLVGEELGK